MMLNQLQDFVIHHWELWLAFVAVLGLLLLNEHLTKKQAPPSLSTAEAIQAINHQDALVIDMRDAEVFKAGHIVGAKNHPGEAIDKLEKYKTKPLLLVCARGLQSSALAAKLTKQDFSNIMTLAGGITAWKAANLPLTKGKK